MQLLDDCRCPRCAGRALAGESSPWNPDAIHKAAIACRACAQTYDVIWGAPFLGHYEHDDILGLMEIATNARDDNPATSSDEIRRVEDVLQRYHQAPDKAAFSASCSDPYVRAPWFQNRYTELSTFAAVAVERLAEAAGRKGLSHRLQEGALVPVTPRCGVDAALPGQAA
jgi:hypothetical protein